MKITIDIAPEEAVEFITALSENMQKIITDQLTKNWPTYIKPLNPFDGENVWRSK